MPLNHSEVVANTLGVVCVHYDPKKLAQTLRSIGRITEASPAQHTVFVANHEAAWAGLNQSSAARNESTTLLRHDNSGMEFGAYQAGLDRLLDGFDPDWVLFANDTFSTHHAFGAAYRKKLAAALELSFDHPGVIGQVVALPRSYQMRSLRTHRWVTTNLFAVNRAALRSLDARIYRADLDPLVTQTSQMEEFFAPDIDPFLREHLEAFLFGARPGWRWYACEPLQPANVEKMARKARSILQEKYLSASLESLGAEFVNLNELSVPRKVLREVERKLFAIMSRGI